MTTSAFETAVAAVVALPADPAFFAALSESELLEVTRVAAAGQQAWGRIAALAAGDIARRSAPSLGHDGLAQRVGARTPEELVRVTTGSTKGEAKTAVLVGTLAREAAQIPDAATGEIPVETRPWLSEVGLAVTTGRVSQAAAIAIADGLGAPSQDVTVDALAAAAHELIILATTIDATRLRACAVDLRNDIDEAGIVDRERAIYDARSLRMFDRPNGAKRIVWDLDLEHSAMAKDLYDRATSPRLGGPRFAEKDATLAQSIIDDPRSPEQLAHDAFAHMLIAGADADSSQILGTGAPQLRLTATAEAVASGDGHGRIEGISVPISFRRIQAAACNATIIPVIFDAHGQPLDVGKEQRLYTRRQRIALAIRDGGCRWPGCERPPSWCEAHHINQWVRDDGRTDTADGMLLCKFHHLLLHDHGWEINRDGADYWLVPPPDIDSTQTPIPMPTKSKAMRDLERELLLVE